MDTLTIRVPKNVAVVVLFAVGTIALTVAVCGVVNNANNANNGPTEMGPISARLAPPARLPAGPAGPAGGVDWVTIAQQQRNTVAPAVDGYINGTIDSSRRLDDTMRHLRHIERGWTKPDW